MPPSLQIPANYWLDSHRRSEAPPLFGLVFNQVRREPHCLRGAIWCNGRGIDVGRGDLAANDIERIRTEIPEGVYLMIRRRNRRIPSITRLPGAETILAMSEILITKDHAWWILFQPHTTPLTALGITLPVIPFQEAWERVRALR